MRIVPIALGVAATLALLAPSDAAAQGRENGHAGHGRAEARGHARAEARRDVDRDDRISERVAVRDRDGRVIVRDRQRAIVFDDRDVDRRYDTHDRGRAPAFCRSGAGHPVYGRRWCLEKGFGIGDRGDVFFLDDDRVAYWRGDDVVVVRDRRLDRDRTVWERVLDTILFWTN